MSCAGISDRSYQSCRLHFSLSHLCTSAPRRTRAIHLRFGDNQCSLPTVMVHVPFADPFIDIRISERKGRQRQKAKTGKQHNEFFHAIFSPLCYTLFLNKSPSLNKELTVGQTFCLFCGRHECLPHRQFLIYR